MKMLRTILMAISILAINTLTAQDVTNPEMILSRFEAMVSTVQDYQCRMYEWCGTGVNYEKRIINYYFSRPRYIRMDIIKGNKPFDHGSVGIFSGGEKVDGRKGGILSGVVVSVKKKDALATNAIGLSFDESDLIAMVDKIKYLTIKSRISFEVRQTTYLLVFEIEEKDPPNGITKELIVLDKQTLLPLYSESWKGKTQIQQESWTDYTINSNFPITLFNIKNSSAVLDSLGIQNVANVPVDERKFNYE